jgi:6-phosphogluconolactonase/glucosamine-6-phosphate isomerase/deaminase
MQFIKTAGTTDLEVEMTGALNDALATNKPVLWILSGGSNIAIAVRVMDSIEATDLHNLTLILADERFGVPGHPDSNFFQLHQAGLSERGATFVDLLYGGTFEETIAVSDNAMKHLFAYAGVIIGFLGIGVDGHIAGILPNSPAAVDEQCWVIGYKAMQYERMTLTPFALSHVQKAFVGAYGEAKLEPLKRLHDEMLPIAAQPAQILRHLPDVKIFNDQIGE